MRKRIIDKSWNFLLIAACIVFMRRPISSAFEFISPFEKTMDILSLFSIVIFSESIKSALDLDNYSIIKIDLFIFFVFFEIIKTTFLNYKTFGVFDIVAVLLLLSLYMYKHKSIMKKEIQKWKDTNQE